MAISPLTKYPGQIDGSDPTGYPDGKARDDLTPDDGTGTPLQQDWLNDLFGFQQALLDEAGLTASGTPDKVGASQYLDALLSIANQVVSGSNYGIFATYTINTGVAASPLALTEDDNASGGFTLVFGNAVEVPDAGNYLVSFGCPLKSTDTTVNTALSLQLKVGGDGPATASDTRLGDGSDPTVKAYPQKTYPVTISDPSTQRISLTVFGLGTISVDGGVGALQVPQLSIVKVR